MIRTIGETDMSIFNIQDISKPKVIRFGERGAKTNQSAKQRKAFKSRHRKNIAKGQSSAAYWANKVKW